MANFLRIDVGVRSAPAMVTPDARTGQRGTAGLLAVALFATTCTLAHAAPHPAPVAPGTTVAFVPQSPHDDPRVAYSATLAGGAMFVTHDGLLVYRMRGDTGAAVPDARRGRNAAMPARDLALVESLVGARPVPRATQASGTRVSRIVGRDPARWQRDVPAFDRLTLGEAWPGITVDLAAHDRAVEKIFTVAPGADVRSIAVHLRGADRVRSGPDGTLVADVGRETVRFSAPVAWQDIDGARRPVPVAYALKGRGYGFTLGDHDPAHPVVIDPILQATYAGGNANDVGYAIAVAPDGDVYVAGSTLSFNFPGTRGGAQPAANANSDAFVARFSRDLTVLRQATYLGGAGSDAALALAIDATGAIVIAGSTNSTNFPETGSGPQSAPGGGGDAFVARLSADLTQLLRATYVGGSAFDQAFAVLATADGAVYVAGSTASTNFPVTAGGAQAVRGGNGDGFVARFSADLGKWVQSTYIGGTGSEIAYALVRDAAGDVFVAGSTSSANLPGTGSGVQAFPGGNGDAFVAKFDAGLTNLARATYLGGAGTDVAYALAYDGTAIVVAGDTLSTNFPVTSRSAQPVKNGGDDAFVTRLDPGLGALLQSTFVGGPGDDLAYAVTVDATGAIFIAGETRSTVFPGTANGAQAQPGGNGDAFIARLDGTLGTLVQSTYIGGSGVDQGFGFAVDTRGHAWITGGTTSFNLPQTAGGAQSAAGGSGDAFVVTLTASLRLVDSPAIEYRYPDWNHYFVTANTDEIAKLDAGVFAGWVRTGQSFKVLPLDTAGAANVCRFFSVSFAPKSSHFYTPSALECAAVKANPDWEFEAEVFAFRLPDAAGACGTGTLPLYRLYNDGQGGAPNHRYTTDLATRKAMLAQGWISEGYGDLGVIGCVPR